MSIERHARPEEIDLLARAGVGSIALREHIAGGCVRCTTALRQAAGRGQHRFGRLVGRIFARDLAGVGDLDELAGRTAAWGLIGQAEERAAPGLLDELLAVPAPERRARIRQGDRYASHGLVLHLVERAREEGFREPPRAVELAALAVEVAEVLPAGGTPSRLAADAQALAWAMLANAHRIQGEMVEAERAMAAAKRHLAAGTGHAWTLAEVRSLEASLRTDQARFDDARRVLEEAAAIYEEAGDQERLGKVLIKLGNAAGEAGAPEQAIRELRRARAALAGAQEGTLATWAAFTLAHWLQMAGRLAEARALCAELRPALEDAAVGRSNRLRFLWITALVEAPRDADSALRALLAVRTGFEELESPFDVCLVTLDLALLELDRGRPAVARSLARDLVTVFSARQLHHHALAALALLVDAATRDRLDRTAILRFARYLRRARNNPYLRFEPDADAS